MLHNMSRVLGFKLHFQDEFVDFVRDDISGDYLRPILPGANYYPKKCDFIWGGINAWHFNCFRERYMFQNFFDLYHTQMYLMLSEWYSIRLRQLAGEAFQKIKDTFIDVENPEFYGVHVRHEYQYSNRKQDDRKTRNMKIENYFEMLNHMERKYAPGTNPVYLAIGDTSLSEFKADRVVYVEDWLEQQYPQLTRLQIVMVAIDILSRCRLRIVSKFGNNFILHMAFHRLNNHMYNIVVGDIFAMRTYSYFGNEIEEVGNGFDLKKYFKHDNYNPYMMPLDRWSYDYAVTCFREYLYSPVNNRETFKPQNQCFVRFLKEEIGSTTPKSRYPTKKKMAETSFF